ncbi:MAG: hypothetical protein KF809_10900 [Chloroflexi bacterium]|nr:hypothetical protein [Chloroflexota bacterium]
MSETVGIRELRQHLSRYTARTIKGESFDVTDRGQPVGRLVPPASGTAWLDDLIAAGRIAPAHTRSTAFPRPTGVGMGSISDALSEDRSERLA